VVTDEGRIQRVVDRLRRVDASEGTIKSVKTIRKLVPGDPDYGDPLSTAGGGPGNAVGRTVSSLNLERPSAVRELGLGALQIWQRVSEAQGRGRGDRPLAILFTDLVRFSNWAVDVGDEAVVELLRRTGVAVEGAVTDHRGTVVKRLGDGLMAVFDDPADAVAAAHDAIARLAGVEVQGYTPRMRAGIHLGRPRRLGGDYVGVDVNVAARVMDAAKAGEVLVSEDACRELPEEDRGRSRRLHADGIPKGLRVVRIRQPESGG
jgi:adenylate cyclase